MCLYELGSDATDIRCFCRVQSWQYTLAWCTGLKIADTIAPKAPSYSWSPHVHRYDAAAWRDTTLSATEPFCGCFGQSMATFFGTSSWTTPLLQLQTFGVSSFDSTLWTSWSAAGNFSVPASSFYQYQEWFNLRRMGITDITTLGRAMYSRGLTYRL